MLNDLIIKGLNILVIIYFANHLSVEDFGLLSLLIAYLLYFISFIEFGTSHLALKEIINLNERDRSIFITNIFFTKTVLFFISLFIFYTFFYKLDFNVLAGFIFLLFVSTYANDWYFKSLHKNKLLFKAYLYGLLGYLYFIFIIEDKLSVVDYFVFKILSLLITILLMLYYILNDINISFKYISFSYIKNKILKKSFPLFVSVIAVTIYYNSDIIMLGIYRDMYEVGIYSAYYKFVFIFLTIKAVIVGYLTPKLSKLYVNKEYYNLISLINRSTKLFIIFILVVLPLIYFFKDYIVSVTFGDKYNIESSKHLLFILLLTVFVTYSYLLYPTLQIVINKQVNFMKYTICASLINILSNIYLIPYYGFIGASYSTLISESVLFVMFYLSYKKFKDRINEIS